jgi:hypothetical protein
LEEISIDEKDYVKIILGEESHLLVKGKPDVPTICRSVIVPDTLHMGVQVLSAHYQEYDDLFVAPSKGNLMRSVNPEDIPYVFDDMYSENTWFPEQLVKLQDPYILRDFRGQVVQLNPFRYNPVEKKLRFYHEVILEVSPKGQSDTNIIQRSELPSIIDYEFKQIYERHFLNFKQKRYDPVSEQGNMIVITYDDFWEYMTPFVAWKNMRGVPTEMVNLSDIGNANDMDVFIDQYYHDNGLTFVLLVGDIQQMPTLYPSYGASDPSFSYIEGNDHYPDLFVGRFSAQTPDQVITQVERSIEYERDPQLGAEWYHKGMGVASNLGPGDDGEYDDEHMDNIRADLLAYTYTAVDQIYDPYGTDAMVKNALNDGRSVGNYCGHGTSTSWSSTGFNNNDINQLENDNMLPFMWSVACSNGYFDGYDTCFSEAWLRATNAGEPTGAIGFFASSVGQPWDPPMDAQDECVDILVESYETNKKHTYGALSFHGCMHMNDEYGSQGWEVTDTWHVFGDPSLQVRTDTPTSLTVSHESTLPYGSETFELEIPGVEDALCAISLNGELLGYGYSDEAGHAVIEFFEPIDVEGDVDLVVSAYNTVPYMTQVTVGESNEPPEKPQKPDGPTPIKPGKSYLYSTKTIDPNGHKVCYLWDWGDNTTSEWIGPFNSDQTATATHSWEEKGTYTVKVKSRDVFGLESEWSDPLSVRVPRSFFFGSFLETLFPRFTAFLNHFFPIYTEN